MSEIRDRAKEILNEIPEPPKVITSDGATGPAFTRLTGTSHERMWSNWVSGGHMTACNGFVGTYGAKLGAKHFLGVFELKKFLEKIGKGDAWVESTADNRPNYGDICRHASFHMSVSLDFDGDYWLRAEAGQGGPVRDPVTKELKGGHDILKRSRSKGPYDYKKVQGWIDLDVYFGSVATVSTTPAWLPGWWRVAWRGQSYYYYVDRSQQVKWSRIPPRDTSQPMMLAEETGTVAVERDTAVIIRWSKSGAVEQYMRSVSSNAQSLQGRWNNLEPITATKL